MSVPGISGTPLVGGIPHIRRRSRPPRRRPPRSPCPHPHPHPHPRGRLCHRNHRNHGSRRIRRNHRSRRSRRSRPGSSSGPRPVPARPRGARPLRHPGLPHVQPAGGLPDGGRADATALSLPPRDVPDGTPGAARTGVPRRVPEARACCERSAVRPKGGPRGVGCGASHGGGSPAYGAYAGDPDNAARRRAGRRGAGGTFGTRPRPRRPCPGGRPCPSPAWRRRGGGRGRGRGPARCSRRRRSCRPGR